MAATKQTITRIGIDGGDYNPEDEVRCGIQRLVGSFIHSKLLQNCTNKRWFYYYFNTNASRLTSGTVVYKNISKRLFSSLFLPLQMALDQIRVYLGFSGILPHLVRMRGQKSIVFIHDFGFYSHPQYYKDPRKMIWQTEYALYGADRVIVFSDYIKDQIFTRFPEVSRKKVVRIYPGGDHIIKPKQATQIGGKFFLFVGVIKAAKNIELLLRYFSEFMSGPEDKETKLILIGPREDNYYKKICASPLYHKICANLLFLNDISDRELAHYYLNCQALLNVSHEEGFCYPVIEALRLGSHVIVNDLPLYREFKPNFERLHIEQNSRLFVNAMCKVAKKADPPEIANSPFTWSNFTRDLLKVIDEIIS